MQNAKLNCRFGGSNDLCCCLFGKDDSITNNFIKQVNEKKQSVKQMVRQKSIR